MTGVYLASLVGGGDRSRRLTTAGHPTLVVSSRWDNLAAGEDALGRTAFGAVSDTLTHTLDVRRVIIDGWAHGCQHSGTPFNDALCSFWDSARRADAGHGARPANEARAARR